MQGVIGVAGNVARRIGLAQQVAPVFAPGHRERVPSGVRDLRGLEVVTVFGGFFGVHGIGFTHQRAAVIVGVGLGVAQCVGDGGGTIGVEGQFQHQLPFAVVLAHGAPQGIIFGVFDDALVRGGHLREAVGSVVVVGPGLSQYVGDRDQVSGGIVAIRNTSPAVVANRRNAALGVIAEVQVGSAAICIDVRQVPACIIGIFPYISLWVGISHHPAVFIEYVLVLAAVRNRVLGGRCAHQFGADARRGLVTAVRVL